MCTSLTRNRSGGRDGPDPEYVAQIDSYDIANRPTVMSNVSTMGHIPEARVLIIMTGGTICMQKSPNGLVPARNFLERCMAPRPEFNDGETHDPMEVRFHDGPDGLGNLQSLRTPTSVYGKRVRQVSCFHHRHSVIAVGYEMRHRLLPC
jgi:hypothetical protein